jgi:hypothetical protein
MAESYITRKGSSGPQTELPTITFISRTNTSLTFNIKNEDDVQAFVYYELEDETPDLQSIELDGNTTSSNITFSNLPLNTTYTLYVSASAFGKSISQIASNTQTTDNSTIAPTITYVSKTFDSITFTVKNNESESATIFYENGNAIPTANSITLNAGQTSGNLTISGLTKNTSYTIYAQALIGTRNRSTAVSFTQTTLDWETLANPTITFVSATSSSITFTVRNNANVSANIYYEQGDNTPDANFVTLGTNVTSSNITISGLTPSTSYIIYAEAQKTNYYNSGVVSLTQSTTAVQGQQMFTSSGTFVVPAGVTSISVVCVGGGSAGYGYYDTNDENASAGGGGGALAYKNNLPVSPGQGYTVTVGAGSSSFAAGGDSIFYHPNATVKGGGAPLGTYGQSSGGDGGGSGGFPGYIDGYGQYAGACGGGGAGGYSNVGDPPNNGFGGAGGGGSQYNGSASPGSNGAGGGGRQSSNNSSSSFGGRGGGVGLNGRGANGVAGASGGGDGGNGSQSTGSGAFGGGGSGRGTARVSVSFGTVIGSGGSSGGVRVIWGAGRAFPATNTGNV